MPAGHSTRACSVYQNRLQKRTRFGATRLHCDSRNLEAHLHACCWAVGFVRGGLPAEQKLPADARDAASATEEAETSELRISSCRQFRHIPDESLPGLSLIEPF